MEKERRLELLTGIADEFNLSAGEIVAYWAKNGRLTSDVETFSEVKVANILPGMYVYTDNIICAEVIPERQIKAVVAYIEDKTVYAVCLQEKDLRWSSDKLDVPMFRNWTDGQYATQRILETADKEYKQAEAAQWCHDYEYDGVKKGEAFLPSITELKKIFFNRCAINEALRSLNRFGRSDLSSLRCYLLDDEYASSNVENGYGKFILTFDMGNDEEEVGCFSRGKLEKVCVRPVLKIQL